MMQALLGFDVDAIQEYVFAASRPIDILGASQIVEEYGTEVADKVRSKGGEVVYVGGGAGTFLVPSIEVAHDLATWVDQRFSERTCGAGRCSAAAIPYGDGASFKSAAAQLAAAIARRKQTRWLDEPSEVLADVSDPRRLCQACGRETATVTDRLGDDTELIGNQCQRRRERGRNARRSGTVEQAMDLNDLFASDVVQVGETAGGTGADRRRLLAALYLDVDRAGEKLALCGDSSQLGELSRQLRDGTQRAFTKAVKQLGLDGRVLAPVVGGDDLLIFVDASFAGSLLAAIWDGIEQYVTKPTGLHSSAGLAMAVRYLPLRLLTQEAGVALREAKEASYGTGEPHVSMHVVGRVRRSAPVDGRVFGAPIPASCWSSIGQLVDRLGALPPAQRSGLLADLAGRTPSIVELDIDYRAVHRDAAALAEAVEAARAVAAKTGAEWWSVLAGGLFAVDLGWRQ
jgi:hypothetical protein